MNVLASLTVLGLLIFFHEAGHFLAAILQGIRVNGFSIGFGPSLIKKEYRGITYSIRALPLGGYVSFPDDEKESDFDKNDPNLLSNRPIFQRAIVISAGVIANLLVAWVVLIGQTTFIGIPNQPEQGVIVMAIQPEEPAYISGLQSGDQIISVNGIKLGKGKEAIDTLVKEIKVSPNKAVILKRSREENIETIKITPFNKEGYGRIGAQLQPNIARSLRAPKNLWEIVIHSSQQFADLLTRTINGYGSLITNFGDTAKQLSGPVKIVEIGAQLSEQSSSGLFLFASLVSINLAVLNSLPFPLLDGGQLAILLLEFIRGKPIPERIQIAFMQSGFVLLVSLSIILIIRDTSQLSLIQQLVNK